jgi:hypothetical protein
LVYHIAYKNKEEKTKFNSNEDDQDEDLAVFISQTTSGGGTVTKRGSLENTYSKKDDLVI